MIFPIAQLPHSVFFCGKVLCDSKNKQGVFSPSCFVVQTHSQDFFYFSPPALKIPQQLREHTFHFELPCWWVVKRRLKKSGCCRFLEFGWKKQR